MSCAPSFTSDVLAPKYAGAAFTKKGKTIIVPKRIGTSQSKRRFFGIPNFLLNTAAKATTTIVVPTKTSALSECDKISAPDRREAVPRNVERENRSLCKNK